MTRPARAAAQPASARTGSTRATNARPSSARTPAPRTTSSRTAAARSTGPSSTDTTPRTGAQALGTPRPVATPIPRTGPVHRPQLRVVPPARTPARGRRAQSASRRAPFVVLVVGLLIVTTVSLLLLNTAIAVDSLDATRMRTANAEQAQQVAELQQRVVDGSTAAQLAREAGAAGLVPAGAAAHLVLGADGTSVVRGTAAPASAAPAASSPASSPAASKASSSPAATSSSTSSRATSSAAPSTAAPSTAGASSTPTPGD
jgi:hypothetical protein